MRSYWIRAGPYKKRENWADTQSHVEKEAETGAACGQAKDAKDGDDPQRWSRKGRMLPSHLQGGHSPASTLISHYWPLEL